MTNAGTEVHGDPEAYAAEAVGHAEELESRLLEGDETVTHEQLAEASSRARFAGLRLESFRRRQEREAHEARVRAAEQLAEEMLALAPLSPLPSRSEARTRAVAATVKAVEACIAALDAYHEKAAPLVRRASEMGIEARGDSCERIERSTLGVRVQDRNGGTWEIRGVDDKDRRDAVRDVLRGALNQLPEALTRGLNL